jgi:hypothetical protein
VIPKESEAFIEYVTSNLLAFIAMGQRIDFVLFYVQKIEPSVIRVIKY